MNVFATLMKVHRNSWRHLDLPSTFLLFGGNGYGFIDKEDGESMFAEASILSASNSRYKKQDMLQYLNNYVATVGTNSLSVFHQFFHFHIFYLWLGKLKKSFHIIIYLGDDVQEASPHPG